MVRIEAIDYLFASIMVRTDTYCTIFFKYIFCFIVILTFEPAYFFQKQAQTKTKYLIKHPQSKIHLKDNWNIHNPNTDPNQYYCTSEL